MFAYLRCASADEGAPCLQMQVEAIPRLDHGHQPSRGTHFNGELFAQFTSQSLRGFLARFDFSAGEFPKTGMVAAERPLGDQKAALIIFDQGRDNMQLWSIVDQLPRLATRSRSGQTAVTVLELLA